MVRMDSLSARKPRELSGGQQQRVAVARAIVNSPSVLLLDEPLGALDLKLRKEMQVELKQLQRRLGMTFIYVTHDQEEALTMSDRIAVMNGGKIEQVAAPVEVYNRPRTRFVADFVGETNLLAGTVEKERADGAEHLRVNGERIPVQGAAEFKAGEKAYLSIRPEMVTVTLLSGGEPLSAGPALSGAVEETIFVGSVWKTIVKLPGNAKIVASEPPSSHGYLEPGTAVLVGWDSARAVLLTE
jgi:spermidine/putrescine transport system ATP-binding protein